MTAFTQAIANVAVKESLVYLGIAGTGRSSHRLGIDKSVLTLHRPRRTCRNAGKLLMEGIAPEVLVSGAYKQLSGCYGSSKEMGIYGHIILTSCILFESLAEPIAVVYADIGNRLTDFSAEQRCTAAAGANGNNMGKALVKGTCDHGGLAKT